jgi:hypothetical protein
MDGRTEPLAAVGYRNSTYVSRLQLSVAGPKPFVNTETPCSKQVSLTYPCFAPASTLPQSLKQCIIAKQCGLLTTAKMLHWLAGAKQPEGSGKHAHQNIEPVANAAD